MPPPPPQERLGIQVGIDPASASARMNRYEQGTRIPTPALVERIADELGLPAAYFYAVKDEEAKLLQWFSYLSAEERANFTCANLDLSVSQKKA